MTIDPSTELDPYEHRGQYPDVCAVCHGPAVAHAAPGEAGGFGDDFRGGPCEGVVVRTLGPDGARLDQAHEVTIGYRNYAGALHAVHALRAAGRAAGSRAWWLPMQAGDAVAHLRHYGFEVPAELAALVEVEA